jgi:hypothetical protein
MSAKRKRDARGAEARMDRDCGQVHDSCSLTLWRPIARATPVGGQE